MKMESKKAFDDGDNCISYNLAGNIIFIQNLPMNKNRKEIK
jgi:hypothetical protein